MDKTGIYEKVKAHIAALFEKFDDPKLVYHNFGHTEKVVSHVQEIAAHYNLNDHDMLVVVIAAWFHDAGYLMTEPALHEQKSVELLREFMQQNMNDEELISAIAECIMATKAGTEPTTILQQIIADADTYNLATDEFSHANKQVYEEYKLRNGYLSSSDWDKHTVNLLEKHRYHTACCKDKLNRNKMENLEKIKERLGNKR